ncbi:hypothetical protein GCM10010252_04630 [Streptomyces aureoverticillatus]|nr:hypothetical protein GCM10010252_04630 [Streptomyces aureoverticillatus]
MLKDRVLGAWVSWTLMVSSRLNRMSGKSADRGAGFVEYMGLIILVAGIFVALDKLALDDKISTGIGDAVARVTG